jgi:hypothetical protein
MEKLTFFQNLTDLKPYPCSILLVIKNFMNTALLKLTKGKPMLMFTGEHIPPS